MRNIDAKTLELLPMAISKIRALVVEIEELHKAINLLEKEPFDRCKPALDRLACCIGIALRIPNLNTIASPEEQKLREELMGEVMAARVST